MRKTGIVILRGVIFLLSLLLLVAAVTLKLVDRTPALEQPKMAVMQHRLADFNPYPSWGNDTSWGVGYSRLGILPAVLPATAGYGSRKGQPASGVRDSLFVNILVLDNSEISVAIISLDLLIVPPALMSVLAPKLEGTGFSIHQLYLGATHTHNGPGHWSSGVTEWIYGDFHQEYLEFLAEQISHGLVLAVKNKKNAVLNYGIGYGGKWVKNRLDRSGSVDSAYHLLDINRVDGRRLMLVSYTAHPTCLREGDLRLSRDFPGALTDSLEARGIDFAMYLAGAVGSHSCRAPERGDVCIDYMASGLTGKILQTPVEPLHHTAISLSEVRVELGKPQAKISEDLCLRPWVFRWAMGSQPNPVIRSLQLGQVLLLGTPCDFSGELTHSLDSVAQLKKLQLMVTSFNGGYAGYITRDIYYDRDHYETRYMNWYGPGNGAYFQSIMAQMIEKHTAE